MVLSSATDGTAVCIAAATTDTAAATAGTDAATAGTDAATAGTAAATAGTAMLTCDEGMMPVPDTTGTTEVCMAPSDYACGMLALSFIDGECRYEQKD